MAQVSGWRLARDMVQECFAWLVRVRHDVYSGSPNQITATLSTKCWHSGFESYLSWRTLPGSSSQQGEGRSATKQKDRAMISG